MAVVQLISQSKSDHVPVVLIHDGGGTIFQYFMLSPMNRTIYGIANPYFDGDARPTNGGIPELAKEYAEAIRRTIKKGSLIIGGWSLGGLISLEVTRILVKDPELKILGFVMIDSSCPWSDRPKTGYTRPSYRTTTSEQMKIKIDRAFSSAHDMIRAWPRPPPFSGPPAVLIRALKKTASEESAVGREEHQDDKIKGWSAYASLQIVRTIDLSGDHFSIFEDALLPETSAKLLIACDTLESYAL